MQPPPGFRDLPPTEWVEAWRKFDLLTLNRPPLEGSEATRGAEFRSIFNRRYVAVIKGGEAGFITANDQTHRISTKCLPLLIAMAGYDRTNKIAFIAHFIGPQDVNLFKEFFYRSYPPLAKTSPSSPIQIHLRGGVKNGVAEEIVRVVKNWINESEKSEFPMNIASEEVLLDIDAAWDKDSGLRIDSKTGALSNFTNKMYIELSTNDRIPTIFLKKMKYDEDFLPPLVELPYSIDYAHKFKDFPVKLLGFVLLQNIQKKKP